MEKISYVFNHREYTFQGECIYPEKGQKDYNKRIYRGNFTGANPHPKQIFPDQEYILIQITVDDKTLKSSSLPQSRQYWDAADFEGRHLRQVLGRNDAARKLADELREGYSPVKGIYQILEPVYQPIEPYLKDMSPYEKLDLAEQSCCALEEFSSFHFPSKILCHRDFKLGNLMIEAMAEQFRARLIDYASLCRVGGDGTIHEGVSSGNTAPEVLGLEDTGFKVCDRTDVFALAGVLGQLFGSCNPISRWSQDYWPQNSEDLHTSMNQLRGAYKKAMRKYPYHPNGMSWLERELENKGFTWNEDLPADLLAQIKQLFRQMIPIDPENRISLEEVHEILTGLLDAMRSRNLAVRTCSHLYLKRTVLLFDRRLLSRHRTSYLPALMKLHETARLQARKSGCGGVQLTCLAYGWVDQVSRETIEKSCFMDQAGSVRQLVSQLEEVDDQNHGSYSLLPQALLLAGGQLNRSVYSDPTIHVFAPDDSAICYGAPDIHDALDRLNRQRKISVVLHSVEVNGNEDDRWYGYHDRLSPPTRIWDHEQTDTAASYVPPHKISNGPDAWFILRNGRKIFVGKRV